MSKINVISNPRQSDKSVCNDGTKIEHDIKNKK